MGQCGYVVKHNLTCSERGPDSGLLASTHAKSDSKKCHIPPAHHICHQTHPDCKFRLFLFLPVFSVKQVNATCNSDLP